VVLSFGQQRPMRGIPTTQSPTIEARRFGRWRYAFRATNYVSSMDALFAREVQFFVRPSAKLLRCPNGSN